MAELDTTTKLAPSPCVECKKVADHATGTAARPTAGDWTLCIHCGSLNVFDERLILRMPTVDEFLTAAKDPDVQRYRRTILRLNSRKGSRR